MEIEFEGSNCMSEIYVKLPSDVAVSYFFDHSNQIKRKSYSVNPIVEQSGVFGISFFITFLS